MKKSCFSTLSTAPGSLSASGLFLAIVLVLGSGMNVLAQDLQVNPPRVAIDESVEIYVDGLQPNERVTIQASLVDGQGATWTSQADFVANEKGSVDASKQAPARGSYEGVSAMGLVWSMKPATNGSGFYLPPLNSPVQTIEFRLIRNGVQTSTARLQQVRIPQGMRRIRLGGGLHGFLFLPDDEPGPFPGVLVVGGSEGGLPIGKAMWLASHGFAAVALAYFRYEDLPPNLQAIPLEYFQTALRWMERQPDIIADRIGVVGTSRGGELALQLGSMYTDIHAVVAYVPANVRYPACCGNNFRSPAWTLQGVQLPFFQGPLIARGGAPGGSAEIQVEQTRGPILLISGQEDEVWSSSTMADAVVARLRKSRFTYPVEHLKYAHAGHRAGSPEIAPATDRGLNPSTREITVFGGTATGNAQSNVDAIPKVLAFLRRALDP